MKTRINPPVGKPDLSYKKICFYSIIFLYGPQIEALCVLFRVKTVLTNLKIIQHQGEMPGLALLK